MEQAKPTFRISRIPWKGGIYLLAIILLTIWLLITPSGILGKADAVGYAVCHRIDVRSFHIGSRQLPLCARCSGQYLGAMLGLAYLAVAGRRRVGRPSWGIILVLAAFLVAYGIDGLNSYIHLPPLMSAFPDLPRLYEPSNTLRLLTGTGVGLGIAVALFSAFNSTVWKDTDPRPALSGWRSFGLLVGMALIMDLLILTESPIILFPLALVSAVGVIILLTMIYTIVLLMLFHQENHGLGFSQVVAPVVGGFCIALTQIAIVDIMRYLITHSWSGINFG
jgi:uncharacterized membrane protein